MSSPETLLDRFFDTLVGEIREHHPAYLRTTFTVAEIYQNLVPYRTHRDRIGAEINGDYEDALLRLLAGEGDFLDLQSEPARKRIQDELRGSNPNTTIYREFAAAEVRLNRARVRIMEEQERVGASWSGQSRVEVGGPPEAATEVISPPGGEAGVNPDLGLFVADLFGEPPSDAVIPPSTATVPIRSQAGPVAGPAPGLGLPQEETPRRPAPPLRAEAPPPPTGREPEAPPSLTVSSVPASAVAPPPQGFSPPVATEGVIAPAVPPASLPERAREPGAPASSPAFLRPQGIEEENHRLRRIVADQALEIQRLRELLAER